MRRGGALLFVGFDPFESLAHSVFVHSVQRNASAPVSVARIDNRQLVGIFDRPFDPAVQSTQFKISRFLAPWLCGFEGWTIFADGDMLCRANIWDLLDRRDSRYAVQVVKHGDLRGREPKFLGRAQKEYPRKNWSSVMLMNCAKCEALTPDYVNRADWLELHQFLWLDDHEIGSIDPAWNHLVSVDAPRPDAKLVHYTLGMPFFEPFAGCEYADEWRAERAMMEDFEGARIAA